MTIKELNETMKEYAKILIEIDNMTKHAEALKQNITDYMKAEGVEVLTGKEHKAQILEVKSNRLDTKQLKADIPALYAKYLIETTSKRFLFK